MKKKSVLNLIRCHTEKNEAGFRSESYNIAQYFDSIGDSELAQYIMALLSGANTFAPQTDQGNIPFLSQVDLAGDALHIPAGIEKNIRGIINSTGHAVGVNKFLFEGSPGTGKTQTAKLVARTLNKDLYMVDFEGLIDSKLGQTSKNIATVFSELKKLPHPDKIIVLFDEIDAIALDRINANDLREMGRVTSSVLKGIDGLADNIVLIATTNLFNQFDKALTRRFDLVVNFNQYSREDLIKVAELIVNDLLLKFKTAGRNMRLFRKIVSNMEATTQPGQLKNIIKTSLAFSDPNDEYDYLNKFYQAVNPSNDNLAVGVLRNQGFTIREMSILTGVSKSQVARNLKDVDNE